MTSALALLLTDYSASPRDKASASPLFRPAKQPEAAIDVPPKQQAADDQGELIRRAEAKARAEERDVARRNLEEALAAERVRSEEELKTHRALWAQQEGARLASCLAEGFAKLEAVLSDRVANILMPFLSEGVRQQSLSDFRDALKVVLSSSSPGPITIAGPQDLLCSLRAKLDERSEGIEFVASNDIDVRAASNDTIIETQLQLWSSRLTEILRMG